ncbi:HTH-type transcriptional activator IlvY [Streptomyces triticagri]|uniref:HTH-type transcriptional activator IlvY n=1 Tax=Streptomyces triticagri TaxID=2293568 RepID=A0A372M2C3_9ACTN|nr:HTH-type transcriptional activator IlvY [Streptomyces triticagri]RFU85068.1 HTH-type transcriptional activator IlvY [Streptomyces triticagri]
MDERRELTLFLHLTQTLNFGRTSHDCHVSPATLTRVVKRLEASVGHRLLDRGPTGVSLTTEGRRFRRYAEDALALWQAYRRESPGTAELTGRLSLFATVTACQGLLPDLLAPFRTAHPQVRLDLRTGDAASALARLDEGEVDAAVAALPARLPSSLVSRTVAGTGLVFVRARTATPGAGGTGGDTEADEAHGPYVLPHRGLVREEAHRWFKEHGASPDVCSEPDGHEALLTLVALGVGTGIVPRLVLEQSAVRDRLTVLRAPGGGPGLRPLRLGLCVRRADLRRPLVGALWSLTAEGRDAAAR